MKEEYVGMFIVSVSWVILFSLNSMVIVGALNATIREPISTALVFTPTWVMLAYTGGKAVYRFCLGIQSNI